MAKRKITLQCHENSTRAAFGFRTYHTGVVDTAHFSDERNLLYVHANAGIVCAQQSEIAKPVGESKELDFPSFRDLVRQARRAFPAFLKHRGLPPTTRLVIKKVSRE